MQSRAGVLRETYEDEQSAGILVLVCADRIIEKDQKNMPLLMRFQRLAALGCKPAQVCSICSIALREFCKEMRLFGGLRSVPSIETALPAFIASMRSAGN